MPSPRSVEIIAHRGASRDRLENTMGAFQAALGQGADAFELDVHATRDGVVVVHHDPAVKIGSGNTGLLSIAAVDLAELQAVTLSNGEHVPTLDDVLALAEGKVTVYVEVKGRGIESAVVQCLARHPRTRTAVHSFDHRIPQTVGRLDAGVPLGILSSSYVIDTAHLIRSAGARDLWQHTALVDQALIDAVHANAARIVVWTENSVDHAIQLVQMGVDAICTDIPGVMRAGLAGAGVISPAPMYPS